MARQDDAAARVPHAALVSKLCVRLGLGSQARVDRTTATPTKRAPPQREAKLGSGARTVRLFWMPITRMRTNSANLQQLAFSRIHVSHSDSLCSWASTAALILLSLFDAARPESVIALMVWAGQWARDGGAADLSLSSASLGPQARA